MKKNQDLSLLLIEDNPGDARLIREMLKESKLANYECTVAENLTLALSRLENHKFDIIILDLNLPESSGIETLDRIIGSPGIMPPIIVLTGLDDEAVGTAAIERGAEDYLVKGSISAAQMLRSIRYAIERNKLTRKLRSQLDELRRWQEVMVDREGRAIELKKEVNSLLRELGRVEKYGD